MKFDDDGNIVPANLEDVRKLKLFRMSTKKNEILDTYVSMISTDEKSVAQLAKVHALIKEIAVFTGHGADEIKLEVKKKAGLAFKVESSSSNYSIKSFAECSKDELSAAIQACILIGDGIGCYVG